MADVTAARPRRGDGIKRDQASRGRSSRGYVSVEMRRGSPATEDFLPEYLALKALGWKGNNGTAMMSNSKTVFLHHVDANFTGKGGHLVGDARSPTTCYLAP